MARIEITIDGKAYPCRPTMGAMLRFKEQTGREVTEINANSVSDQVTYLWCCIKAACAREKVDFDLSLMDFADSIDPDDINAWNAAQQEDAPAGDDAAKKA